jgi:hypothetical protein
MNIQCRTAIALSVLGFAAASAFAQGPSMPRQPGAVTAPQGQAAPPASPSSGATGGSASGTKNTFETLDKDHDGSISRGEAAASPELVKSFATLDRNRDGKLDRTEFSGANLTK